MPTITAWEPSPEVSHDQTDEQVNHMVGQADVALVPVPAATFEITEGLFLPVATGIFMTGQAVVVGDECPGFVITHVPYGAGMSWDMPTLLESQPTSAPNLIRLHCAAMV